MVFLSRLLQLLAHASPSREPIDMHTRCSASFSMKHGTTQPSLWTLLAVYLFCLGKSVNPCACTRQWLNVQWTLSALQTAQPLGRRHGLPTSQGGWDFRPVITSAVPTQGIRARTCALLPADLSARECVLWWPAHQPARPCSPGPTHGHPLPARPTSQPCTPPSEGRGVLRNNCLLLPVMQAGHRPHQALLRGPEQGMTDRRPCCRG